MVSPWLVRNAESFNPPVLFSTDGSKTLAGANCNATYSGTLIGYWESACLMPEQHLVDDEGRYD